MGDDYDEYDAEREEEARLRSEIASTERRLRVVEAENKHLENVLAALVRQIESLTGDCRRLDSEVSGRMNYVSNQVGKADLSTKNVFDAISEVTDQYFTFKQLSTATKNLTQFTGEYFQRFGTYNDLRRITIGYVIGLDSKLISSETARKKVEKAYLQNTDYWLAYSIAAVMLWASDEKEAAERAVNKSLSMNYFDACLFYLLINLRFNRLDAAKKWYVNYLDRVDMNNLGTEWQYLLQAYLFGAFGRDEKFQNMVGNSFRDMMAKVEVSTVDFSRKVSESAENFAKLYPYQTDMEFTLLRRNCEEYKQMRSLLSEAEKNAEITDYYDSLFQQKESEKEQLHQRIENVLYSLVSSYDDAEEEVVDKLYYNNAIVSAKGNVEIAQAKYNDYLQKKQQKKNMGDLLISWAFAEDSSQTDVSVRRFALTLLKESVAKGFTAFADTYRKEEKQRYHFNIDGCKFECDEDEYKVGEQALDSFYHAGRFKQIASDKHVKIYSCMCAGAVLLLLITAFWFSPVVLTIGILTGLAGSFLLWRRISDLGKVRREKNRKSKLLLKQVLQELHQWRDAYRHADGQNADLLDIIGRF